MKQTANSLSVAWCAALGLWPDCSPEARKRTISLYHHSQTGSLWHSGMPRKAGNVLGRWQRVLLVLLLGNVLLSWNLFSYWDVSFKEDSCQSYQYKNLSFPTTDDLMCPFDLTPHSKAIRNLFDTHRSFWPMFPKAFLDRILHMRHADTLSERQLLRYLDAPVACSS